MVLVAVLRLLYSTVGDWRRTAALAELHTDEVKVKVSLGEFSWAL